MKNIQEVGHLQLKTEPHGGSNSEIQTYCDFLAYPGKKSTSRSKHCQAAVSADTHKFLPFHVTVVNTCGDNLKYICFSSSFLRSAKQHSLFNWRRSNNANNDQQLNQLVKISCFCFITLNSKKGDACIFSRTWHSISFVGWQMHISMLESAREIFASFLLSTSPTQGWMLEHERLLGSFSLAIIWAIRKMLLRSATSADDEWQKHSITSGNLALHVFERV